MDIFSKLVTIGVTVLYASIVIGHYSISGHVETTAPIITMIFFLIIYFLAFAFRPIKYEISETQLIVRRLLLDVKIYRNQIEKVELLDKEKVSKSIRIFGVGGLFGYYGKFANSRLGNMSWYATRKDKIVLVTTRKNRKIILTPDEPETFVANLKL